MKCTVCTFVNASWHGCAPTIMYCLASGSGYREPVSTQVFAISAMLSRSSLTLSLSLSCAHTHSHLFLPLPHSLVHIFFYIYTRTHFCFPFFSLFSPFFFPPPFRWEISTLETSAPQRWNQARLSLIKRRGGRGIDSRGFVLDFTSKTLSSLRNCKRQRRWSNSALSAPKWWFWTRFLKTWEFAERCSLCLPSLSQNV